MLPDGMYLKGSMFLDHSELGVRICIVKCVVPLANSANVGVVHQVLQQRVNNCTVPTQSEVSKNIWNDEKVELAYNAALLDQLSKN